MPAPSDTVVDRLRAVIDIQNEIAATRLDADAVMAIVTRRAAGLTGAEASVLELADGDEMVYRAVHGAAEELLGMRLPVQGSLSGLCVLLDEPLRCDDAETDPRVNADACRRAGVGSMICVPLRHSGQAVGAFKVYSGAPGAFDDDDVEVLGLLSGVAAAHLTHAAEYTAAAEDVLLEREQKERLEELDRMRQEVFSLVTHDLQSPLTCISGYLECLLDGSLGEIPAEQRQTLDIVARNAERLSGLVGDLLVVSRGDSARLGLDYGRVDVPALVEACAAAVRPLARASRIDLVIACHPVSPLDADPRRIEQVLTKLLSNAVKYTRRGGRVDLLVHERPGRLCIRVADSGIGIPHEEQERLFERFFRASTALQERIPGSGLGLAITKMIVDAHGGTIAVASEPGAGTVFTVELPCADAGAPGRVVLSPASA